MIEPVSPLSLPVPLRLWVDRSDIQWWVCGVVNKKALSNGMQ